MKKIYYFIALIAITAFSACSPLDKTYKDLGSLPAPATVYPVTSTTITLSAADYALLPKSNTATKTLSFKTLDSAKAGIPFILAAKYPNSGNKSSALVTYGITNPTFKPADSTYSHVYYAVINPDDYVAAQGTTNTTFKDYSDAQVLLFLKFKYPTPVDNQLAVLNYTYYASGITPSSGVNTTDSFIYLNGAWMKIYTVSNAQYASAGHGNYNQFVTADAPATIVGYINTFLKTDPTVAATAKVSDVKYVSYNYYISSGTSKGTYQRVQVVTFDGTNWVTAPIGSTALTFLKTNGTWVADNTVNYALVKDDYTFISKIPGVASDAAMTNLGSFGDFNIQGGATSWTDDQINKGIIAFLKSKFTTAVANQKFVISYLAYNGANVTVTKTFLSDGTTFALVK
ncbi:MAG: hypothetical protein JWR50_787 [Mucilaginibacter sp.]|nr:hypothetical protein [Mucilaginibacter sp.]